MKTTGKQFPARAAIRRLMTDLVALRKDPLPSIHVNHSSNALECYFVFQGKKDSPYEGGYYLGKIEFPKEFPHEAPDFCMITPNGRFAVQRSLCLSISNHQWYSWNPSWSLSPMLEALYGFFMFEDTPTTGSIWTSDEEKRKLARSSWEFNLNNEIFVELFPNLTGEIYDRIERENARREDQTEEHPAPAPEIDDQPEQASNREILDTAEQENARPTDQVEDPSATAHEIDNLPQKRSYQEMLDGAEQKNMRTNDQVDKPSAPAPDLENQHVQTSNREMPGKFEEENARTNDEEEASAAPSSEINDKHRQTS